MRCAAILLIFVFMLAVPVFAEDGPFNFYGVILKKGMTLKELQRQFQNNLKELHLKKIVFHKKTQEAGETSASLLNLGDVFVIETKEDVDLHLMADAKGAEPRVAETYVVVSCEKNKRGCRKILTDYGLREEINGAYRNRRATKADSYLGETHFCLSGHGAWGCDQLYTLQPANDQGLPAVER